MLLAMFPVGCSKDRPTRPVRGTVVRIEPSRRVVVEVGDTRGITPGTVLQVYRDQPGQATPTYLGFVTVTEAGPAGDLQANQLRATGDNDCQPMKEGDRVSGSVVR